MNHCTAGAARFGPVGASRHGRSQPLPIGAVAVTDGLFADWHRRNREVTIPHGIAKLEEYGNLDNLRRLAGESEAAFRGQLFADSDVYKTLEAVAWELGRAEDETLRTFFEHTVSLIERAQRDDGYLDSAFQDHPDREPWSNFTHGHELYCLGHLIQAAVAANRALNDTRLLAVADRFVDLVEQRFGGPDATEYCGHPLIESALIELARETGRSSRLDLAEAFIRRRGSGFIGEGVYGAPYYQDDSTVLETTTMRGHAVRALYLNQGVADLFLERGDVAMLDAIRAQWNDLVAHRMHLTGGTGSRHQDEAFGDAYELPADRAYAETCAGIALFGWAWRMYLATGSASYLDVGETALYNVVLAGISEHGDAFTYSNPLQRRRGHVASRQEEASKRLPWFDCACCPPNLMRTFASMEHYLAARRGETLELALFASARIEIDGARLTVQAEYPATGRVVIGVDGEASDLNLALRVPGWADLDDVRARIDGAAVTVAVDDGWLRLGQVLRDGAVIELELPMPVRTRYPHRRADALRGTGAVLRGPVVYCADQADNDIDVELAEVDLDHSTNSDAEVDAHAGPSGDVEGLALGPLLTVPARIAADDLDGTLYRSSPPVPADGAERRLVLRPYATWGNGEIDAMRVWLPRLMASGGR